MWLGGGEPGRWTDEDLLLLLALEAYEESLCGGCGQPKHKAWGDDRTGYYERDALECGGCATLHPDKDTPPPAGEKRFLRWVTRR